MADKTEILQKLGPHGIYGPDITKAGTRFKMKCPFHTEKTPSFVVYPDTLAFHCYGCGKGGSAFDYVMEKEGIQFEEALKILAEKAGVPLTLTPQENRRIYETNTAAMEFYREALKKNPKAMQYLTQKRGFTEETIDRFKIGCTATTSLNAHLRKEGFSEAEILEAGLANKKDGRLRDYFFRRIMFPILRGTKVLGFSGRVVTDEEPKYLNSPATPIFQKRQLLYGFDPVAVKAAGFMILVEGNPDVAMSHQHGYKNTAAALGTAITEDHAELIAKYTNMVILILDGDNAGRIAAQRSAKILFDTGLRGLVIALPPEEDPDSFLRKGNKFEDLYASGIPFASYLVNNYKGTRYAVYASLVNRGLEGKDPFETAEFLAYSGTEDETDLFRELQARQALEREMKKAQLILKQRDMEIRKYHGTVALFIKGKFLLAKEASANPKAQAMEIAKKMAKIRSRAAKFKTIEKGK